MRQGFSNRLLFVMFYVDLYFFNIIIIIETMSANSLHARLIRAIHDGYRSCLLEATEGRTGQVWNFSYIALVSAEVVVTGQKCSAEIYGNSISAFSSHTPPQVCYFFLFAGLEGRPSLAYEIFKLGTTGIGSNVWKIVRTWHRVTSWLLRYFSILTIQKTDEIFFEKKPEMQEIIKKAAGPFYQKSIFLEIFHAFLFFQIESWKMKMRNIDPAT